MKHIAYAYGRALFPHRYGPRDGAHSDTANRGGEAPMALPPGGVELDLASAVYRLTGNLERLVDSLRKQRAARRRPSEHGAGGRPVECG